MLSNGEVGTYAPRSGRYPIQSLDFDQVQVQIQTAPITPEGLGAFLGAEEVRIRRLLDNSDCDLPRRAVVVLDASNQLAPRAVRRIQAAWMAHNSQLLSTVVHSMGIVIPGALSRGAFTAMMWILGAKVPWQIVIHPDLQSAIDWAIQEARSIGGTVATELVRDRVEAVERKRSQLTHPPLEQPD